MYIKYLMNLKSCVLLINVTGVLFIIFKECVGADLLDYDIRVSQFYIVSVFSVMSLLTLIMIDVLLTN